MANPLGFQVVFHAAIYHASLVFHWQRFAVNAEWVNSLSGRSMWLPVTSVDSVKERASRLVPTVTCTVQSHQDRMWHGPQIYGLSVHHSLPSYLVQLSWRDFVTILLIAIFRLWPSSRYSIITSTSAKRGDDSQPAYPLALIPAVAIPSSALRVLGLWVADCGWVSHSNSAFECLLEKKHWKETGL